MKERFLKLLFVFGLLLFFLPISIFFKYFSTGTAYAVKIQSNDRNTLIIFIILEIIVITTILRPTSQQKMSLAEKWKALKLEVENLVKELTTKKEEQTIDEDEEKLIKRLEEVSLNLDDAVAKYEKHKSYQESGNKDRSSYYFQSSRYSLLGVCKELRYLKYNEGLQKSGFNNVIMKLYEDVKSDIGLMYGIKR